MKKMLKRRSGFTLVELLIVIIIIGILAGAMLLVAGSGGDSAEATKIISDLRSLKSAALLYYADHPINPQMPNTTDLQKYMDRVLGASYDITGTNGTDPYFDNWWISSTTNKSTGVQQKLSDRATEVGLYGSADSSDIYTGNNAVFIQAR